MASEVVAVVLVVVVLCILVWKQGRLFDRRRKRYGGEEYDRFRDLSSSSRTSRSLSVKPGSPDEPFPPRPRKSKQSKRVNKDR